MIDTDLAQIELTQIEQAQLELPEADGPRYRALAQAMERAIVDGRLAAGCRLPPQRSLAYHLGVTIGTVGRAYELLIQRGLARGEVGRGTFVLDRHVPTLQHGLCEEQPVTQELTANAPLPIAEVEEATALLADMLGRPGASTLLASYPRTQGTLAQRRAAATWLGHMGTEIAAEQLLLTAGAQAAVAASLATLARPGDGVLLEALTFRRFVTLATTLGLRPQPVAIDAHGLLPEALDAACRQGRGRVLLLSPNLNNPTTALVPLERRLELLAIARRHDMMIVEDDVYGPLVAKRPPSLASLDPSRVVLVASLSKFLAPGLRAGMLAAPSALIAALTQRHADLALAMPAIIPELLARLQAEGLLARAMASQRAAIAARQRAVRAALTHGRITSSTEALHIWLELPLGTNADDLTLALAAQGIRIAPGREFAVDPRDSPQAVRISIGGPVPEDQLLRQLARIDAQIPATPTCGAI